MCFHYQVAILAWIPLILSISLHPSLPSIVLGRSSKLHFEFTQNYCWYVFAGQWKIHLFRTTVRADKTVHGMETLTLRYRKIFRSQFSAKKDMSTGLWDIKSPITIDFLEKSFSCQLSFLSPNTKNSFPIYIHIYIYVWFGGIQILMKYVIPRLRI